MTSEGRRAPPVREDPVKHTLWLLLIVQNGDCRWKMLRKVARRSGALAVAERGPLSAAKRGSVAGITVQPWSGLRRKLVNNAQTQFCKGAECVAPQHDRSFMQRGQVDNGRLITRGNLQAPNDIGLQRDRNVKQTLTRNCWFGQRQSRSVGG